jgi:hypothetical protein
MTVMHCKGTLLIRTPSLLGPLYGLRHRSTVGSLRETLSHARGTPVIHLMTILVAIWNQGSISDPGSVLDRLATLPCMKTPHPSLRPP